jgi:hypothetical protein
MPRQLKVIILVNVVIAVFFCYFNWANWTLLNHEEAGLPDLSIHSEWGPVWINVGPKPFEPQYAEVMFPNYPLMLFWLSTIINLYFIIKLQKNKETIVSTP